MNSRERVIQSLDHNEPDRIPIDLGATIVSSIVKKSYIELMQQLGLPVGQIKMLDYVQQLPYLDESLLQRFEVDFRLVQLPAATTTGVEIFEDGDYLAFIDRWGSKLHMPKKDGLYFDWVDFPIKEPSMRALDAYRWPQPDPDEVNAELGRQAKALFENTDFSLVGSAVIGGGIFEQPARIMGMQNFLMALLTEPAFADRLMGTITDIYIESCNRYLDHVGPYIQVFTFWDDLAGQNGWMINPALYRKLIKPKQKRLVEAIKKRTKAKLFYHSCGATREPYPRPDRDRLRHLESSPGFCEGDGYQGIKSRFRQGYRFLGWRGRYATSSSIWKTRRRSRTRSNGVSMIWRPGVVLFLRRFITSRLTCLPKIS